MRQDRKNPRASRPANARPIIPSRAARLTKADGRVQIRGLARHVTRAQVLFAAASSVADAPAVSLALLRPAMPFGNRYSGVAPGVVKASAIRTNSREFSGFASTRSTPASIAGNTVLMFA